ncbi:hypothetical protein BV25DRAFT_1818545 [Artomyces pyxidatus]|uniref:Uncharacterized protein n=1 Tax=Artomyces pyxidatus TaxID=48021 RepID=A0ACB8TID5_9AGAM|nr:hypothetical protein BV25DRAFT_1818545 [Artomyces pyxidatus]
MTAPKALLLALTEPGPAVTEAEFHDWCDNEHIPQRVKLPTISSWTRAEQIDGAKPSWAAYYDFDSVEATKTPPYSSLADTRSEREKDILSRIEVMERRIYEEYTGYPSLAPSALYNPAKSAPFVVIVSNGVNPGADEEFNRWYDEEHIPLLSKAPGWVRSRRFVLKETQVLGREADKYQQVPPKYMCVHEWASQERNGSEEYKHAMTTPWRMKVTELVTGRERREFKLYGQWTREE